MKEAKDRSRACFYCTKLFKIKVLLAELTHWKKKKTFQTNKESSPGMSDEEKDGGGMK
jgi:hypothetical protein